MKTKRIIFSIAIFTSILLLASCKKDQVEEPNEEELITTMRLTFVPVGAGSPVTYQFDDADGPGGLPATQDEIVLATSTTYDVTVQLLNKTVTPADDITGEVADEPGSHRFYYEPTNGTLVTVNGFDTDAEGIPVGITSRWVTGAASMGNMTVTLRHYAGTPPGKEATDPSNSSKSSTDIEVVFDMKIQ